MKIRLEVKNGSGEEKALLEVLNMFYEIKSQSKPYSNHRKGDKDSSRIYLDLVGKSFNKIYNIRSQ